MIQELQKEWCTQSANKKGKSNKEFILIDIQMELLVHVRREQIKGTYYMSIEIIVWTIRITM